ncbi:MAG: branched-chain amino acid ABC transporter permease [Alphaproteobacteria bacterium]|nr:branched-chain amino acid ABC transporter permease [Alphaproteobacteria bacterium]
MNFVQLCINGVAIGCIYALVALGFVLIYKATETVNFAQGDLMMLGAFFAYTTVGLWGWPFLVGVGAAVAGMMVLGALLDRIVLRPVVGQPAFALVMLTIGIGTVARAMTGAMPGWGTETYSIPTPYAGNKVNLGELVISVEHLVIISVTVGLCVFLFLFFRYTKLGVAMQASSQNQLAAYYMGIPVKTVFSLIWGLSAGVAGIAGILLAPITLVDVNLGFIGLKAFPAAVLGGFGSIPGAIVGGLIIGVIEALAGFYLPLGFKDIAAYVVLLVVLFVRPHGLFGQMARKKV